MDDETQPYASGSRWEPEPDAQRHAEPDGRPTPGPAKPVRSRLAVVGTALAALLVGGTGGFAIGHSTGGADSAGGNQHGPGQGQLPGGGTGQGGPGQGQQQVPGRSQP